MTQLLIVRILLIGIGSILLLFFLFLTINTVRFLKRSVAATGRVKGIRSADRKNFFRPVIEFNTASGETVEYHPKSSHSAGAYTIDQEVALFYDPDFPQDARIKSFFYLWFAPVALFVAAALVLWAGFGITAEHLPVPGEAPSVAEEDPYAYYLLYWIGPVLFFAFGFGAMAAGCWNAWKMISTLFWPSTRGKVIHSSVQSSGRFYSPDIRYEFKVGGKSYASSNFDASQLETGDELEPEKIVRRYKEGTKITVYYNPRNPADCVLKTGIGWPLLIMLFGAGVGFSLVGWIFWIGSREGWVR